MKGVKETFIFKVFLRETLFTSIADFGQKQNDVIISFHLLLMLHNKMDQEAHENVSFVIF